MTSSAVPSLAPGGGLADLSGPIFKLALNLDKEPADMEAGTLAARFDDAIKEFEGAATRLNVPLANIRLAKYGLTAFIDQKVLTSDLALKDAWLEKPLQMTYFDDFNAGEEFYVKLDQIRNSGDSGRFDVTEVYYLCLVMGFTGKYGDKRGEEQRRILIDRMAREISESRQGAQTALSPAWQQPATSGAGGTKWWLRAPAWAPPAAVAVALLLLWLLLGTLLIGRAEDFPATTLSTTVP
jgi:type VI secretion system protein ImpK